MTSNLVRAVALAAALAGSGASLAADHVYTLEGFTGGGSATRAFSATDTHGDPSLDWHGLFNPAITATSVSVSTSRQSLPVRTAVPETWALVLAGLCVVVYVAGRHRSR